MDFLGPFQSLCKTTRFLFHLLLIIGEFAVFTPSNQLISNLNENQKCRVLVLWIQRMTVKIRLWMMLNVEIILEGANVTKRELKFQFTTRRSN